MLQKLRNLFTIALSISILLLILFGMTSCSYYTVVTLSHIHDTKVIGLGWGTFILIALANAVMAESFKEDFVKLVVFTLFFLTQLIGIVSTDTPSTGQYQMFIFSFGAAWGTFFGGMFAAR